MKPSEKYIVVLACRFASGANGTGPFELSDAIKGARILRLTCGASVHSGMVLSALEQGAQGVVLLTCPGTLCHFREGARWAAGIARKTSKLLGLLGFSKERVRVMESGEGTDVYEEIRDFAAALDVTLDTRESFRGSGAKRELEGAKR
jgi:coenzyme F420-reducing hydrogenase delta subunit